MSVPYMLCLKKVWNRWEYVYRDYIKTSKINEFKLVLWVHHLPFLSVDKHIVFKRLLVCLVCLSLYFWRLRYYLDACWLFVMFAHCVIDIYRTSHFISCWLLDFIFLQLIYFDLYFVHNSKACFLLGEPWTLYVDIGKSDFMVHLEYKQT